MSIQKIAIHASLDHSKLMEQAAKKLIDYGYVPILPDLYRYQHIREKYKDLETFNRIKNKLARENCENMNRADGVLILNPPHRGYSGYVGGASFCQMVISFFQNKPIFLCYEPDQKLPYWEEILSFHPIFIGDFLELNSEEFDKYVCTSGFY